MGLKDNAKALIDANVYANGQEHITGQGLNATLKGMVDILPTTEEINNGIAGFGIPRVATTLNSPPNNPTETKHEAFTAGTYTNWVDENDDPIVVTEAELLENDVFFYVKNGVSEKYLTYNPKNAEYLGAITPSTTIPADKNIWGTATEGTYANAGNLTVAAGKLGILSRVAGVWSKVEVAMPKPQDGNQFYSLAEMPNLAYGNWGDVVEVNNSVYKKMQTKKVRYIKIETGGTDISDGVFFTWLKAFDANGVNVAVEPNIAVTTSHPITEGVVANLSDNSLTSYIYIGNVTAYSDIRWMQVDLKSVKDITKIEESLYPERKAHDKKVMVSADGVTWETLFDSNIDGEYTESNTVPTERVLSGWQFQFNINTPPPIVAEALFGDTWNLSEGKKTLILSADKSISVTYTNGDVGELTVDGKGFILSINGQNFVTDDVYKMHFRLLEMAGELVIIPTVLKIVSESPYKELTAKYIENSGSTVAEGEALQIFTSRIKNFYEKILAFYPHTGNTLEKKTLNLVRPFEGKENFQETFTTNVVDDVNGIKVPSGSTNRLFSNVEPLGLSDLLNYGFFFHKKQLVEGGDMLVAAVGENGTIWNELGSYHPKAVGSNDYIQIFSSGFQFTSQNEAGLISIRRNTANQAIISVNRKADFVVDIDTDSSKFVAGANAYFKYPQLALIGQNGDAVYSCWGIYQGLTAAEHTILMNAVTELLTTLNRI